MLLDILLLFGAFCYGMGRFLSDIINDLTIMAREKERKKAQEGKHE